MFCLFINRRRSCREDRKNENLTYKASQIKQKSGQQCVNKDIVKTNNEGKRITTITVALSVVGNGATLLTERKKFPPKEKVLYFPKKIFYSQPKITNFSNGKSFLHLSEKTPNFPNEKKFLYLSAGKLISYTCVTGLSLFIYLFIYLFIFQRDPFQMSFVYGSENFYVSQT